MHVSHIQHTLVRTRTCSQTRVGRSLTHHQAQSVALQSTHPACHPLPPPHRTPPADRFNKHNRKQERKGTSEPELARRRYRCAGKNESSRQGRTKRVETEQPVGGAGGGTLPPTPALPAVVLPKRNHILKCARQIAPKSTTCAGNLPVSPVEYRPFWLLVWCTFLKWWI
jgi:hypothetical protein